MLKKFFFIIKYVFFVDTTIMSSLELTLKELVLAFCRGTLPELLKRWEEWLKKRPEIAANHHVQLETLGVLKTQMEENGPTLDVLGILKALKCTPWDSTILAQVKESLLREKRNVYWLGINEVSSGHSHEKSSVLCLTVDPHFDGNKYTHKEIICCGDSSHHLAKVVTCLHNWNNDCYASLTTEEPSWLTTTHKMTDKHAMLWGEIRVQILMPTLRQCMTAFPDIGAPILMGSKTWRKIGKVLKRESMPLLRGKISLDTYSKQVCGKLRPVFGFKEKGENLLSFDGPTVPFPLSELKDFAISRVRSMEMDSLCAQLDDNQRSRLWMFCAYECVLHR